jgi:hypothetical protein
MTQLTSLAGRLEPHARGHLLLFDNSAGASWTSANGLRLLLIVLVFEGVLGPRLERLTALGMPVMPTAIRYAVLIAVVCALATRWAGVPLASLGLRPWRRWTLIEKSYVIQAELVRRWGKTAGILVANTLYTFGPLHSYYWTGDAVAIGMLAAIFSIGLFFSLVFDRSGNLLLVGTFHGVGNWFGVALPKVPGFQGSRVPGF